MTALFQRGSFTLASGRSSSWKIECDALTLDDWAGLAAMAVEAFGAPGPVFGVPRGGVPFAKALRLYPTRLGPTWIVDDVLTTGGSMERHRSDICATAGVSVSDVVGVVVFARGTPPPWVHALFQMPEPS